MNAKLLIVVAGAVIISVMLCEHYRSEKDLNPKLVDQYQSDSDMLQSEIFFEVVDLTTFGTGTGSILDEYNNELGLLLKNYWENAPSTESMSLSSLVLYRLDFLSKSDGFLCSVYVHQDSSFVFFGDEKKAARLKQILTSCLAKSSSKSGCLMEMLSELIPK